MSQAVFFYTEELLGYDMGKHHPMQPIRLKNTFDLLNAYGVFKSGIELATPAPVSFSEAAQTHDRNFLMTLDTLSAGQHMPGAYRYGLGTGDNPIFPGIYDASMLYSGGSADAAQAVMDGANVAFNIAGGLHHAHYDRAAGFCVLNDCAIAIRRLRQKFERVAYIDIDVHHGDGVQELFYEDSNVLTVSLHESGRTLFPGTGFVEEIGEGAGEGYSVNLPFAPHTTDSVWLGAWREAVLPILRAFDPQAILLQMGADAHEYDPLAHVCLTAQGWLGAVKDVQSLGVPIVAVGGGGYNMTTVPRMWALATATLAGIDIANEVPDSYSRKDRIPFLLDSHAPDVTPQESASAQRFAASSVAKVKEILFPYYHLR